MPILAAEYRERVDRARAQMREEGLVALMVTGDYLYSANYRYLSGHVPRDYQATTDRSHVLLITAEGGAICAHPSGTAGAKASWVDDVFTFTPPVRHSDLAVLFDRLGVARGRVGAELGDDQRMMLPIGQYEQLKAAFPQIEWVDGSDLLWSLRMVKSPAEIDAIRAGDRINAAALQSVFAGAYEGMTAKEVRALCARSLTAAGASHPPHSQINLASSSQTRGPDGFILGKGDLLFVDTGVVNEGYWAEFNRMGVLGSPSAHQERWHETARRINTTWWEEILRPGVTAETAILEHIRHMEAAGLDAEQCGRAILLEPPFPHHGHGIGLNSSEPPRLRVGDGTVLKAGMVINVETYIYDNGTRYACEEDVVITPSGAEPLSEPDTQLFVIS
jgi:Xaa-Pro dipeptidase